MDFIRSNSEDRGFDLYRPWVMQTMNRFHLSEDQLFMLVDGFLLGVPFSELVIRSQVARSVILELYHASWMKAVLYRRNFL